MTLYEFKHLNINAQAQTTWDSGVFIAFREEGDEQLILYRIENFYVEVRYHSNQNQIRGIKSFISDAPLQPYLDTIDISELINNQM